MTDKEGCKTGMINVGGMCFPKGTVIVTVAPVKGDVEVRKWGEDGWNEGVLPQDTYVLARGEGTGGGHVDLAVDLWNGRIGHTHNASSKWIYRVPSEIMKGMFLVYGKPRRHGGELNVK